MEKYKTNGDVGYQQNLDVATYDSWMSRFPSKDESTLTEQQKMVSAETAALSGIFNKVPYVKLSNTNSGEEIVSASLITLDDNEDFTTAYGIREIEIAVDPFKGLEVKTTVTFPQGALSNISHYYEYPRAEGPTSNIEKFLTVGGKWNLLYGWFENGKPKDLPALLGNNVDYELVLNDASITYNPGIRGIDVGIKLVSPCFNSLQSIPMALLTGFTKGTSIIDTVKHIFGFNDAAKNIKNLSLLEITKAILDECKQLITDRSWNNIINKNNLKLEGFDLDKLVPDDIPTLGDLIFFILIFDYEGSSADPGIAALQGTIVRKESLDIVYNDLGDMTVWSFLSKIFEDNGFTLSPYPPGGSNSIIVYHLGNNYEGVIRQESYVVGTDAANPTLVPATDNMGIGKNWNVINPYSKDNTILELNIDTAQGTTTNASLYLEDYLAKQQNSAEETNKEGREHVLNLYTLWCNQSFVMALKLYGEPKFMMFDTITVDGLGNIFNGTYFVASVKHKIAMNQFTTSLECSKIGNKNIGSPNEIPYFIKSVDTSKDNTNPTYTEEQKRINSVPFGGKE